MHALVAFLIALQWKHSDLLGTKQSKFTESSTPQGGAALCDFTCQMQRYFLFCQLRPIYTVRQCQFFLTQAMGSMAINGAVQTDNGINDFYCDIDLNGEVIFLSCRCQFKDRMYGGIHKLPTAL